MILLLLWVNLGTISSIPGFAAFWDFQLKDAEGRLIAHTPEGSKRSYPLEPRSWLHDYQKTGPQATADDLAARTVEGGPFGKAVRFHKDDPLTFYLRVPRTEVENSPIDCKGPKRSVTLVAWVVKDPSSHHGIAGIWHEGTDRAPVAVREEGRRQYMLFGGLAARPGAVAGHVSDSGAGSFGDIYARHIAVTQATMAPPGSAKEWSAIAMVFDNDADTVTVYLNGEAPEHWIDAPEGNSMFKHQAKAWAEGLYRPPPAFARVEDGQLKSLRANPYWFPYDLYTPPPGEGAPFTIGRPIASWTHAAFSGLIGGVAVYDRALTPAEIKRLAGTSIHP